MPERTRSQRLEDESERAFAAAVDPPLNFYPRPQPEYGIDGEVEEFDDRGRATGLHFFVQLKSTDEADLGQALAVDIALETANYYRASPLPVLMVRYHAPTDSLYARWFHQYDPYEGRGGSKTLRFRWQPEDAWSEGTPETLVADARAFFDFQRASLRQPRPLYVVTAGAFGIPAAELNIALRAAGTERSDVLEVRSGDPPAGAAQIEITEDEIRADLAKVTGATLHVDGGEYRGATDPEQVASDALTMVALAFEHVGQDDIASRLAATYFARSSLATDDDASFALSSAMARAHRISEALELSEALDEPGSEEHEAAAFIFGLAALYKLASLSEAELEEYQQVLKRRAKRRKKVDPVSAGRAYMNLASFLRGQHQWDAATNYYQLARELDPGYSSRGHYWYEYGGALWGTRQYEKAADAYQRAIELGTTEPLALALHADCLVFAGKYAEALALLEEFNARHPQDDGEYRLKARAVRAIVERLGIGEQERQTFAALEPARGTEPTTAEEWERTSLRQLEIDALWGSAWLNLGIADQQLGRPLQALDSFTAATILIVEDFETWQNAIMNAFGLGQAEVFRDLVRSGRRMAGDEMIASVLEIAARSGSPIPRRELSTAIDAIIAEQPSAIRPGFTVRMLREDGSVEEIVVEDERNDQAS